MKRSFIVTIVILLATGHCSIQAQNKSANGYVESVDVYTNNDFLITGETLYYSIHCRDVMTKQYSSLSKLAYVELIEANGKSVLQGKVQLLDGTGSGDFFLPSYLTSGNYTLITYTKWMRNFSQEYFFRKQITIINPYLKPAAKTPEDGNHIAVNNASQKKISLLNNQLQLYTDGKKYASRQKVIVTIKNNDQANDCRISLNVHGYSQADTMQTGLNSTISPEAINQDDIHFLPDLRGETISGVLKDKTSHQPLVNTDIYLSIQGEVYHYQVYRTDSLGRFYFTTKDIHTQNGIRFQLEQSTESVAEITLDEEFVRDHQRFKPSSLSIDTTLRKLIEQRNVYSQIENAYFLKKQDLTPDSVQHTFFGKPDKVYKLDDYTRFPTMEDVFREYIYEVFVLKRDGKFALRLMNSNSGNGSRFSTTPLIIIDGIQIFDTEILMNYNPLLIKTVTLVTRRYVYAGVLYEGILSVHTYTGNAKELPVSFISKEYTSWQRTKKYHSPDYANSDSLKRIPDYRYQLFWSPVIHLAPGEQRAIEFYTSDVSGSFLIEARGFNAKGEAVSTRSIIEVEK